MTSDTVGQATAVLRPDRFQRDLQERVKELTCLVAVCRAVGETLDAAAVCTTTAAAVVLAMQRPALAVAVVELGDERHATDEIPAHHPRLEAKVLVNGREHGQIRVTYTDGGDDFLPEERSLLDALGTTLGLWVEQRESRAALAESDARFRRLVTNIPDVVFRYRTGADEGLDYVSPSVEQLTGFTAEELLADSRLVREIVRPDLVSGDQLLTLVARDGSVHWVEHNVAAVYDRSGGLVAFEGIARDVTDRVAASDAVVQRAAEQEVLARVGQAALLSTGFDDLFDLAAGLMKTVLSLDATAVYEVSSDGLHLSVTHGTGWPEGVVGEVQLGLHECTVAASAFARNAPVVTPAIDEQRGAAPFLAAHGVVSALTVVVGGADRPWGALAGYTRYRREYSADEVQFLQTLGHILGAAVKRTNAEAGLARSEREFRTLAENLPDIVTRLDRDHRYLYVNPRVEVFGLAPGELIGRTNGEAGATAPPMKMWEDAAERVFISGEPSTVEGVYQLRTGDVHLQSLLIPEFDSDGTVGTVVAVTRDISDLRHAEGQRREGLARIVAAQEEERARIGEDIHDDSIQVMAAVGMRLDGLRRKISDPDAAILLGRLEDAVCHSINRLRTLMFELRPPELDRDGLAAALRLHLDVTTVSGLPLGELVDNCPHDLPVAQRTVLYRIALEAITNARKHANAQTLEIVLDEVDGGTRLQVRDDGQGFDTDELAHVGPHHLGTTTMRERADAAGGTFSIHSAEGEGTVVTAWLPSPFDISDRP